MTSFHKQRKHIKPFYSLSADFTTSPYYSQLYSQDSKLPLNDQIDPESGANTKKAHLHLNMSFAKHFEQAGKDQYQLKGNPGSDKGSLCHNMRPLKIKCSSMDKIWLDEDSYTVHTRTEAQNPLANSPTFFPIKISNVEATPYNMESPCMTPIEGSPMLHYIPSPFSPALIAGNRPEMIFPSEIPCEKVLSTFEVKHGDKAGKSKNVQIKAETQIEEQETLICTICERPTPLKDFRKHLELCRDRAVLQKEVADIDNQIGWIVLKAFMASKTLKRNILCDRKKAGKLQSDSSFRRKFESGRHPRTLTEVKVVRSLDPSSEKGSQSNERSNSPRKQKTRHTSIQFDSGKMPKNSFRTRNSNVDNALTSITLTSFSEVKLPDSNTDELEQCQSLGTCSIYLPGDGLEDSFNDSETRNTQEEMDTSIISETQRLHMHKRALSIETRQMDSPRSDIFSNNRKTPKGSTIGSGHQDQTNTLRMVRHASESVCRSSPNVALSTSRNALSNRFPSSRVPSFECYIPKVVPRKSIFCPKKAEIAEEEETKTVIVHQEAKSDEEAEEEKKEAQETINSGFGEEINMALGFQDGPKTNQGFSDRKKNKSITVYGHGSCTNEQFVGLRKRVQEKQKQIDVYEAIQAQAKIVINKDIYTTEMDLVNKTIVSTFDALTSEVKNEKPDKLSREFVSLFQRRIATGKEYERVKNTLNKLEGKSQPEAPNDSKRRAILLQQKSFKNRLELKSLGKKGKDKIPSQTLFSRQNSSLHKIASTPKEIGLYTFDEKQEMQPIESLAYLTEELAKSSSPVSSEHSIVDRECSSMQDLSTDVKSNTVGFKDFEKIKLISKGSCAKVWLVRRKATQDLYAMKVINLARREQRKNDLDNLTKENRILKLAEEEYVTRAVFVFTHETCVCFVMEFMQGGDLRQIINKYIIDEYSAKFYIAELVLAIEYLHSLGIIHRDLKPENVLLNKDGHTKLADFGLSEIGLSEKIHNNGLHVDTISLQCEDPKLNITQQLISNNEHESDYTFTSNVEARPLGTDQYMAPEVVNAISITNKTLDWWSLGIMLFELLTGQLPFDGDTKTETRKKIRLGQIPWDQARKESPLSEEAKDIISRLLNSDYEARLGAKGAKEIKEHAFFKDIVWEDLRKQQTPISFAGLRDTDTVNFESIDGNVGQIEREDPFAVVTQYGNTEINMLIARQFIEKSQKKFQMVNTKALYSEGLAAIEKIESEKEKKMNKEQSFIQQEKSFTDISDGL